MRRSDGPLTDAIGVFAAVGFAVAGRLVTNTLAPGILPFTLSFPAIIFATLFAGLRSGLIAVAVCQLLVWYFVLPPQHSFAIDFPNAVSLVVSTISLALTVWIAAAFRTASRKLDEEKAHELDMLALALREVDHRTKNNFQIAAALLLSQAGAQSDKALAEELRKAASRLTSIASVYANLALSSTDLSTVQLHSYLGELCDRVRDGLLPPMVKVDFHADPLEIDAQTAVSIGLIVNECLTNAVKHAFPHDSGRLAVAARRNEGELIITVEDDGIGNEGAAEGMGSRLIATLTSAIGGCFERQSGKGTRCILRLPDTGHEDR